MDLELYQLDAFASAVFEGNPAAVCPLEAWLPTPVMQAIAAENNLSETAFFVPRAGEVGSYDLRWFTPSDEVALCGHATLASGYVVMEYLSPGQAELTFHTKSGPLRVGRDGELLVLDFPAQPPQPWDDGGAVAAALSVRPQEVWQGGKALALLADEAEVLAVTPDLARVAALDHRGLIVTAPGARRDFVSRYFAPHVGIPEDPVTGSAHCLLAPFWSERLGTSDLKARQVSRRGGELRCRLRGGRVEIAGRVVPYLRGTIQI
jgi:PhzF family phenazine biosynthesis protein